MKKAKTEEEKSEEEKPAKVKVKKAYTFKFYMMILAGVAFVAGVSLFVLYVFTQTTVMGALGIAGAVAGIFVFRYYWKSEGGFSTEYIGEKKKGEIFNSLNLYPTKVEFANVHEPGGFPWECINDKKKYFVNKWDEGAKRLEPFVLPDQQYCEPIVFAQRVLGLPAHKKIFERKPKLLQKLKTALLVVAIGIVWLLILTTTGGG